MGLYRRARGYGVVVAPQPSKLMGWVRFPLAAPVLAPWLPSGQAGAWSASMRHTAKIRTIFRMHTSELVLPETQPRAGEAAQELWSPMRITRSMSSCQSGRTAGVW